MSRYVLHHALPLFPKELTKTKMKAKSPDFAKKRLERGKNAKITADFAKKAKRLTASAKNAKFSAALAKKSVKSTPNGVSRRKSAKIESKRPKSASGTAPAASRKKSRRAASILRAKVSRERRNCCGLRWITNAINSANKRVKTSGICCANAKELRKRLSKICVTVAAFQGRYRDPMKFLNGVRCCVIPPGPKACKRHTPGKIYAIKRRKASKKGPWVLVQRDGFCGMAVTADNVFVRAKTILKNKRLSHLMRALEKIKNKADFRVLARCGT